MKSLNGVYIWGKIYLPITSCFDDWPSGCFLTAMGIRLPKTSSLDRIKMTKFWSEHDRKFHTRQALTLEQNRKFTRTNINLWTWPKNLMFCLNARITLYFSLELAASVKQFSQSEDCLYKQRSSLMRYNIKFIFLIKV